MSSASPNDERTCPECGVRFAPEANSCWLCHRHVALVSVATPATGPQPSPIVEPRAAYQFGISTLLLIMTLLAVLCGVLSMSPGLGVVLAIVATPALVRVGMTAVRRKVRGRPMTVPEKLGAFAGSVGVVVMICLAAGAAFVATCFPVGLAAFDAADELLPGRGKFAVLVWPVFPVVLGILAAGFVGYLLIRRLWRRKDW